MGRHAKTVLTADGLDRRATGYYATPTFVAAFLAARMLALKPGGRRVLDPCVGREELSLPFAEAGKRVDGYDVLDLDRPGRARFERRDFIEAFLAWRAGARRRPWPYDYYVANPPYNCHEADYIRRNKARLQAAFGDVGADNMYALFVAAMLEVAKPGALVGVLTLDSFLTARVHAPLRARIATEGVRLLALCPTDLFRDQGADVRTCLLILEKGARPGRVAVLNRPPDRPAFEAALARRWPTVPAARLRLGEADHGAFVVGCPPAVRALFSLPRLGERVACLTGVSTGDDRRYLRPAPARGHGVPFYKNPGSRRFVTQPDAYLPDDYLAVAVRTPTFIARNRAYLGRAGIACSSMGVPFTACRLPAGGAFGVNANLFPDRDDADWLLAYLNSRLVTYFVRGVLLRTNMVTSGYVARIPLVPFTAGQRRTLAALARAAVATGRGDGHAATLDAIDAVVFKAAKLPAAAAREVTAFAADLVRRT